MMGYPSMGEQRQQPQLMTMQGMSGQQIYGGAMQGVPQRPFSTGAQDGAQTGVRQTSQAAYSAGIPSQNEHVARQQFQQQQQSAQSQPQPSQRCVL